MHTARRGGAARPLFAAVAVAGALVVLLLRFAGAPAPSSGAALPPAARAPELEEHPEPTAPPVSREMVSADAPEVALAIPPEGPALAGALEISLAWPAEAQAQETEVEASRWRLHPAAAAEVAGRLVIASGTDRGRLQLPPGSYALLARAAGWTSDVVRVDVEDTTYLRAVELAMSGCAALEGSVVDAAGLPVEDLTVHVIDEHGQLLDSATTSFGGGFELPCVPPGSHSLLIGVLEGPLIDPLELTVAPEGAALPDVVLPPLGAVEILVLDEAGAPVPDVELSGLGGTGGRLLLSTDFDGRAASELALPGTWRFFADSGALGRGNAVLEVEAGGRAQATLTLRRRR